MIIINTTYEFKKENLSFRIIAQEQNNFFIISLNDSREEVPRCLSKEYFKESLQTGSIEYIQDPYKSILDRSALKIPEEVQNRFNIINQIWETPETRLKYLNRKTRKDILKQISNELGIGIKQAKRLITKYLKQGMSVKAFLSNSSQKRNEQETGQKRGRKPEDQEESNEGIGISALEREQFKKAYEKYHLKKGLSISNTYKELIRDYYCIEDPTTGEIFHIDSKREPNLRQFYYWINKHRDKEKELRSQLGDKEFENSFSMNCSSTRSQTLSVGSRFELDATILNIEVVSEEDRTKVLGRPLLQIMIDVYSRMVTGFYLTLEKESWHTTAKTILNTVEDKVTFCLENEINIQEEEWPSHYLPRVILTDNGPEKSYNILPIQNTYNLKIEFTTSYKGSAKSNVEHKHSDFKRYIQEYLPGTLSKYPRRSSVKNKNGEPSLTLSELRKVIIELILLFNKSEIKGLRPDPKMLERGMLATPCDLWQWGFEYDNSHLSMVSDFEEFRVFLLPQDSRIITEDGIRYDNFHYVPVNREDQNLLFNNKGKKTTVFYDKDDIDYIYININGKLLRLELSDKYESYKKLTREQAKQYLKLQKVESNKRHSERLLEEIKLQELLIQLAQDSNKQKEEQKSELRKQEILNEKFKNKTDKKSLMTPEKETNTTSRHSFVQDRINETIKNYLNKDQNHD